MANAFQALNNFKLERH